METMDFMTNQDSYRERRQLFKNIWETAMNIDDKDDIMNKPKVIKTLRLDDVDKCVIGKKKKQRIKDLRHVCNRILEFCDRQDAEDIIYNQMAANEHRMVCQAVQKNVTPKKTKPYKFQKKVKKVKSLLAPPGGPTEMKATASEQKNHFPRNKMKASSSNSSPMQIKRTVLAAKVVNIKPKASPRKYAAAGIVLSRDKNVYAIRPRVCRKKHTKKKKLSDSNVQAINAMCQSSADMSMSGASDWPRVNQPLLVV